MMSKRKSLFGVILAVSSFTASVENIGAAEFPQQLQAGEHRLILNGWGARTKTFLQLYVAGIYLAHPSSNPVEIVSADEPAAIRIKITSGFVSQAKLVASLTEGFHKSTGGNIAPIQSQINRFRECFKETITKGDIFDIVYVPKHGVTVNKNGRFKGVVAGVEFKKALFNIWLSDNPIDENLKRAMLSNRTTR
jgi:hypothetical protein